MLSNIIDNNTSKVPEYLKEYEIFERGGVRIGVIGLVEEYGGNSDRGYHILTLAFAIGNG